MRGRAHKHQRGIPISLVKTFLIGLFTPNSLSGTTVKNKYRKNPPTMNSRMRGFANWSNIFHQWAGIQTCNQQKKRNISIQIICDTQKSKRSRINTPAGYSKVCQKFNRWCLLPCLLACLLHLYCKYYCTKYSFDLRSICSIGEQLYHKDNKCNGR